MKKILYIFFLLSSIFLYAQQTYKVPEGELQFIVPNKGIIVKKHLDYYFFKKEDNFELENDDNNTIYEFELEKLSDLEFEKHSKSKDIITASDVFRLNFDSISNIRFTETTEDDINQFY